MSNQNALLSLLSQDDFGHLRNQIHGKIVHENIGTGPIEEKLEDEQKEDSVGGYEGMS
jgi:hypothetical protein